MDSDEFAHPSRYELIECWRRTRKRISANGEIVITVELYKRRVANATKKINFSAEVLASSDRGSLPESLESCGSDEADAPTRGESILIADEEGTEDEETMRDLLGKARCAVLTRREREVHAASIDPMNEDIPDPIIAEKLGIAVRLYQKYKCLAKKKIEKHFDGQLRRLLEERPQVLDKLLPRERAALSVRLRDSDASYAAIGTAIGLTETEADRYVASARGKAMASLARYM